MDLSAEITEIRDWSDVDRAGVVTLSKRVTFYVGKFGPFVERFPTEGFSIAVVNARVEQLRAELRGLVT